MILTQQELAALTGKKRRDAQIRALRFMAIDHKIRPDGSVAVLRAHVERELGGVTISRKHSEPNWGAI